MISRKQKKEIESYERHYCRLLCYTHHGQLNHEFHEIFFKTSIYIIFHNCSYIIFPYFI